MNPADSANYCPTSAERNREASLHERQRQANPQVTAQQEADDLRRKREIARGQISVFMEMYRSRLRVAAHPWARAKALAESIIRDADKRLRETDDNKGLLGCVDYVAELERGFVEKLQQVGDTARDEQAAEQLETKQRRESGWRAEAQRMGLRTVLKHVETTHGGRLKLIDDRLAFQGEGALDERSRCYLATVGLAEVKAALKVREQVFFLEENV